VFVYQDDDENASEIYATFVRKLITWLTVKTGEGDLYEIDTALRPNGNAGLLVTRFDAYERYQLQRGTNTAWTWEHQAMTRSRFVMGITEEDAAAAPQNLRQRFDAVREAVITAERDHAALAAEIRAMRLKIRSARPVRGELFDVKHSAGGMVDVEFAVQYLVLAHSRKHPELRPNLGNTKLLRIAEAAGLLPVGMGEAAALAYRELRILQHRARLDEAPTQIDKTQVQDAAAAVRALWLQVLGSEPDRSPAPTGS
jgi:glutamate-ammonia-ligase adenylyltransferase